ncbi:hypothetical protein TNCT_313441 [Trichonephila clavata]|uniref:Uncharacterized protein n=1 Tax=Trichonephila clavata TaxID=2740835 RepID=A0A8X6FBZ0_TRICU|nr:hypothetical protein TNCT_313441 [Trichonephila clavata]
MDIKAHVKKKHRGRHQRRAKMNQVGGQRAIPEVQRHQDRPRSTNLTRVIANLNDLKKWACPGVPSVTWETHGRPPSPNHLRQLGETWTPARGLEGGPNH